MVGILTFHKAINYGAVLQAYALRKTVESLGNSCSVINYVGDKMRAESKTWHFPPKQSTIDRLLWIYRLPMRAGTIKKFNRFLDENLQLSHPKVIGTDALSSISTQYQAFITGSDQVFNYIGTGEDFNYYLEFAPENAKKISYAPSFGMQSVDQAHACRVAEALKRFDALSVREDVGADIVEELIGKRPTRVCDPTFLLNKEQWEQLCIAPKYKKPYVLIYSFGSRHLEKIAKELAREIGGIVVNINRGLPCIVGGENIKNAYAPGPREFLGLIQNAEIVLTNSFHGTALSILLEKEFYAFTNHYANSQATNYRFITLGESLGLTNRIYNTTDSIMREPIDYSSVREKVISWRKESMDFLANALQER